MPAPAPPRRLSVVLFDGFELLDVFGPVELFSRVPDRLTIELVGPERGPVRSNQGTEVVATIGYDEAAIPDIVMVPGGLGTRVLATDGTFLAWLRRWADRAELLTSVCTGSALLAAAGLLNGYRATSNKAAFDWASGHGSGVEWVGRARWVHDRTRWTSSGVAAGMDMAAALLADLFGPDTAARAAREIEFEVRTDPENDPFAVAALSRPAVAS